MQVADAYLNAFSTRDDRSRTIPIVTTVAVHVLIAFGIAMSAGFVPAFKPEIRSVVIDLPAKPDPAPTVDPLPKEGVPVLTTTMPVVSKPVVDIDETPPPPGETTGITRGGGESFRMADPPLTPVRLLNSSQPDYPPMSRRLSEEGIVMVRITITPYGTIGDVQLEKSSGYARLDEAALKAVRGWRFAPARRGSEGIVSSVLVPVKFEIK